MSVSPEQEGIEVSASPEGEEMDRGASEALQDVLGNCDSMEIRQYRRGWWQEFFCCTARSDFEYYDEKRNVVAQSAEDFTFVCRCCLGPCHSFDMILSDTKSGADFIEVNRPFRICMGQGKCCCKQESTIFSGEEHLGDVKETCWWCVPQFRVYDPSEKGIYVIHPPTCCGNMCVDCCPGGKNPCPYGFCMIPCDIYPIVEGKASSEAIGRMAKIPKKSFKECYDERNYFKVDFPANATTDQKGLLLGSSILVNALYFEHSE